ncbi:hypothetical protein J5491_00410 [Candidatus Saccharibacteria bacterium]|nr:hypothetical protein [Candidatus Saccharibacteria bacterium]
MKKAIISIVTICIAFIIATAPTYAEGGCVPTSVLGGSVCKIDGNKYTKIDKKPGDTLGENETNCSCDDGKGSSVTDQLNLVVDIMTIGIGILGVIGITIVGIQYLTAGGSEEKTRKAKRRMFEIVIGLVAYVVLFAFIKWLIPNA